MSKSKAEEYGRRARNADNIEDIGDNVACAIDELSGLLLPMSKSDKYR